MPKCNGGLPRAVSDSRVSAPNLAPPETGHSLYRATKPPARVCFEHGGIHVCLLRRGVFTHFCSGCYLQRRKKEGATGNLVPVQERPTVVILDHCGFRPMFFGFLKQYCPILTNSVPS